MKISNILNIVLAVALLFLTFKVVNNKKNVQEPEQTTVEKEQQAKEWRQVNIDSVEINPFTLFQNAAALTVGRQGAVNSMTIGWGTLGILWGHDSHVATVYVRKSRFTHHLMEENNTFTIEGFSSEYDNQLKYLGTASGRDEDKIKGSGLTLKTMPSGTFAFEEGNIIIECRKLFSTDYTLQQMDSTVVNKWYIKGDDFDNIHTAYVGEITAVWVKK